MCSDDIYIYIYIGGKRHVLVTISAPLCATSTLNNCTTGDPVLGSLSRLASFRVPP